MDNNTPNQDHKQEIDTASGRVSRTTSPSPELARILDRLEGVHRSGDGWMAKCPAHDDQKASLSITERDGKILLHCMAGCSFEAVRDVLGLTNADLRTDGGARRTARRIAATYDYRDENGVLLFQTVRYDPKDFVQRHPDAAGGWIYTITGVRRVLYRLPELIAADPTRTVYVAEGEKGVDRVRREGLVATCSPMGANSPWLDEYTQALRGRRVVVLPDNDPPGRKHAQEVARALQGVATSVKVVPLPGLPEKADVYDWLENGHTGADLEALAAQTAEWQPEEQLSPPAGETHEPRNLADVIAAFRKRLWMPDTAPLELALAAVVANRAPGDPVWLLIVAPPGSGKTEIINALDAAHDVRIVGALTEGALLSGTSRKERAASAKGGLLREIGDYGILAPKDFGSLIAMNTESRAAVLQALREIYDGRWERAVGSDGGRTLSWQGKCGLIGGSTPAIDAAHAVLSTLGERFVFVRVGNVERAQLANTAVRYTTESAAMRAELFDAVGGLLENVPTPTEAAEMSEPEIQRMIALADFATIARAPVIRDAYRREIDEVPGAEAPTRFVKVLRLLMTGLLAIGVSRERAWEMVTRVAIDSVPLTRRNAISQLIHQDGQTAQAVAAALGIPTVTARRALEDLACYGAVDRNTESNADRWSLTGWTKRTLETACVSEILAYMYSSDDALSPFNNL